MGVMSVLSGLKSLSQLIEGASLQNHRGPRNAYGEDIGETLFEVVVAGGSTAVGFSNGAQASRTARRQ